MLENLFLTFVIGIAAGIVGSLLGLGGGIIISPILTLTGSLPSQVASTSLLAVASTGASSTLSYSIKKKIRYSIGIKIAAFAVPFSVIGALVSSSLNPDEFKLYFAILLISTSLYLLVRKPINENRRNQENRGRLISNTLLYGGSSAAGLISSLFGIGGGIIFVPILVIIYKLKMINASPTAQFILLISTITGLLTHIILEHPEYSYGIALALGAFLGAQLGSRTIHLISDNILSKILSFSLIIIAINFVIDYIRSLE